MPDVPIAPVPAPNPGARASAQVPITVCLHPCVTCGMPRSRGFHRDNPIIPGVPLAASDCGKCRKQKQKYKEAMDARNYTSCSESDSPKFKKSRKKDESKEKKQVKIMINRDAESS